MVKNIYFKKNILTRNYQKYSYKIKTRPRLAWLIYNTKNMLNRDFPHTVMKFRGEFRGTGLTAATLGLTR